MPTNLTPVSEYTGDVFVPVGGDPRTAMSVQIPFQTLTNRAAWLRDELRLVQYKGVTRPVSVETFAQIGTWTAPYSASGGNGPRWIAGSTSANDHLTFRLDMPHGSTLTALTAYLRGASGHAGLPAVMPSLALLRISNVDFTAAWSTLGTQTDTSGNTTAYQAIHPVTISSLSVVVDRGLYSYYARVIGESSTNALNGLEIGAEILGTFAA
jgi:hypothetical protein